MRLFPSETSYSSAGHTHTHTLGSLAGIFMLEEDIDIFQPTRKFSQMSLVCVECCWGDSIKVVQCHGSVTYRESNISNNERQTVVSYFNTLLGSHQGSSSHKHSLLTSRLENLAAAKTLPLSPSGFIFLRCRLSARGEASVTKKKQKTKVALGSF